MKESNVWDMISVLGNNKAVLILIAGIFVTIIYCIKKGYFKFSGKGVSIGLSEQHTRDLIQAQFDYANAKCESVEGSLPKDFDKYRIRYVIGKVEDVIQKAIIFNNLTDNESYIKAKQELCYFTVMKHTEDEYFKTPEFKDWLFKFISDLFKDLYKMKKLYSKTEE